jgi:hypothetical protein
MTTLRAFSHRIVWFCYHQCIAKICPSFDCLCDDLNTSSLNARTTRHRYCICPDPIIVNLPPRSKPIRSPLYIHLLLHIRFYCLNAKHGASER